VNMNRRSRPLYRDPSDKMIGGVCSGLGRYFDIDTVLVRIGFVVVALIGGGGILAYALLWGILDPAPPGHVEEPGEPTALENEDSTTPSIDDQVEQRAVPTQVPEGSRADEA
jgi:phage shock protein C